MVSVRFLEMIEKYIVEKAFNRVNWKKIMVIGERLGILWKERKLIENCI